MSHGRPPVEYDLDDGEPVSGFEEDSPKERKKTKILCAVFICLILHPYAHCVSERWKRKPKAQTVGESTSNSHESIIFDSSFECC